MLVHVARLGVFTVDQNGQRINKSSGSATINQLLNTSHEVLVIPDDSIPNSANYPTVKRYLELEAQRNYVLNHLDQTFVVTYNGA